MIQRTFADSLRGWRRQARYSQLQLALAAGISQRHLSFLESGRAQPSRAMVLQLGDTLGLSLRDQNQLLLQAGFAAHFAAEPLDAECMQPIRLALEQLLKHHDPLPALVMNRDWTLVMANQGVARLLSACALDPSAAQAVNVLTLTLSADGLGRFLHNHAEVVEHLSRRLNREGQVHPLLPRPTASSHTTDMAQSLPVLPLIFQLPTVRLRLFTLLTTFGTAQDITTDELRVESFYAMDDITRQWFSEAAQ